MRKYVKKKEKEKSKELERERVWLDRLIYYSCVCVCVRLSTVDLFEMFDVMPLGVFLGFSMQAYHQRVIDSWRICKDLPAIQTVFPFPWLLAFGHGFCGFITWNAWNPSHTRHSHHQLTGLLPRWYSKNGACKRIS